MVNISPKTFGFTAGRRDFLKFWRRKYFHYDVISWVRARDKYKKNTKPPLEIVFSVCFTVLSKIQRFTIIISSVTQTFGFTPQNFWFH